MLFKIVQWAIQNGDEKALARMKVFALGVLMKEGVFLEKVDANTTCSAECLAAVKEAAAKVVGKPCPF